MINSIARTTAVDLMAVNAVAPGWVETSLTKQDLSGLRDTASDAVNPLKRAAKVREIADLIAYLLPRAPSCITASTIIIDGGRTAAATWPS